MQKIPGLLFALFTVIFLFITSFSNIYSGYVGVTTREFKDSSRSNWQGTGPRILRVIIWYPCKNRKVKQVTQLSDQKLVVIKEGEISSQSGKYPLILLSPGSGQTAVDMQWLGHYLSSHGYITVSVNHKGTTEEELRMSSPVPSDFYSWERPGDLSCVLSSMLKDPVFAGRININNIGAAGFSLGGATVIWTAGAVFNLDSLKNNTPGLEKMFQNYGILSGKDSIVQISISRSGNSYKDKRIKAVFALAPTLGSGFPGEGLRNVNIPVMIVAGDGDVVAPSETNAKHYANYIPKAVLKILPGEVGHYTKPMSSNKHRQDLEKVSRLALDFFEKKLKK